MPAEDCIGFLNGDWLPKSQMAISIADDGFRFAATAVERLRTYNGKVFQLPAHLARWRRTLAVMGIDAPASDDHIGELVAGLFDRNESFIQQQGDVGLTWFATPGTRDRPLTFAIHLNAINHDQVDHRRQFGQPVVITDVVQPSPKSWPREIKARCRLHYYLADRAAQSVDADATGVLIDEDGSVTETSIANLAIVKDDKIISPPPDRVLGGITQQVVESLAQQQFIDWFKRPIDPQEMLAADEVILMGTDTGIWFGNRIGDRIFPQGPVYAQLARAFDELVTGKPER
tara:strand:- start:535917 stop:536780 length:864 start_codon:yes stop_codon:yes gene_type:complete